MTSPAHRLVGEIVGIFGGHCFDTKEVKGESPVELPGLILNGLEGQWRCSGIA